MSRVEKTIRVVHQVAEDRLLARTWARGARLADTLIDADTDGIRIRVHNGVPGRAMRYGAAVIPYGPLVQALEEHEWDDVSDRVEAALDVALSRAGYSRFKRTTRWRVDRNGRRQWQVGQVLK